jgi:hypothetical protein
LFYLCPEICVPFKVKEEIYRAIIPAFDLI